VVAVVVVAADAIPIATTTNRRAAIRSAAAPSAGRQTGVTPDIRYYIANDIPAEARTPEFVDLADDQLRLRVQVRDGVMQIIAHGNNPAACEALLRSLGATDIGVDLCG